MVGVAREPKARGLHALAEAVRVPQERFDGIRVCFRRKKTSLEDVERGGDDGRGDGIGEEIRPRFVAEELDHSGRPGRVAAGAAAEGLAERGRDDVGLCVVQFGRAAAGATEDASRVAFVNEQERFRLVRDSPQFRERGDVAVHREGAVRRDQLHTRVTTLEFRAEIGEVEVGVTKSLGLAEANAVDDGRVVQGVRKHGVLRTQKRFEDTGVGVEGGRKEYGVLGAVEGADSGFEAFVDVLRAGDETDTREAEASRVEPVLRRFDDVRVAREAQVIVRREVQARFSIHADGVALCALQNALRLESSVHLHGLQFRPAHRLQRRRPAPQRHSCSRR
mmetsp:Transcript_4679/g.14605  ORF Transcript_4679/g.14605 Transcript_4679/m.14605 type:complete len:335 (+) Transcript_4679:682-1686(+)